jgi:hypothetical protein
MKHGLELLGHIFAERELEAELDPVEILQDFVRDLASVSRAYLEFSPLMFVVRWYVDPLRSNLYLRVLFVLKTLLIITK